MPNGICYGLQRWGKSTELLKGEMIRGKLDRLFQVNLHEFVKFVSFLMFYLFSFIQLISRIIAFVWISGTSCSAGPLGACSPAERPLLVMRQPTMVPRAFYWG